MTSKFILSDHAFVSKKLYDGAMRTVTSSVDDKVPTLLDEPRSEVDEPQSEVDELRSEIDELRREGAELRELIAELDLLEQVQLRSEVVRVALLKKHATMKLRHHE